jgi:hypothetical protein
LETAREALVAHDWPEMYMQDLQEKPESGSRFEIANIHASVLIHVPEMVPTGQMQQ